MPSDLDMLIDHYQWEIVRLRQLIKEHLKLHFYREVEFDERALGRLCQELDKLLELKDPSYPKIKKAENQIDLYERMAKGFGKEKGSEFERIFYEIHTRPNIDEQKRILENLKNHPIRPSDRETQEIDEALFKLIQKKNRCFFLHLDEESGAKLEVFIQEELKFKIKFTIADEELGWYKKHSILREMNFKESADESCLENNFILQNSKNVLPIKEFLATLVIGLKSCLRLNEKIYLEMI